MIGQEQIDATTPNVSLAPGTLYRAFVMRAAPRLLGMLDRDPESPTVGSFDRDHWAWKFRDFPIAMLQTGIVPVAMLYANKRPDNPYGGAPRMLEWIVAAITATIRRQHRNGAFDSVAPFSQDHGVTLQLILALTTALRVLRNDVSDALRDQVAAAVRRGCAFAARSDEDYAFISNHQAFFALAWLRAGELLGDGALSRRAATTIDGIIDRQSADGWYAEYGGPDPGYESLGISYLATYLVDSEHPRLAESLSRSVRFFSHFVHPDGSVGGCYGSRLTQLWYPSGFELLASTDPVAGRIAAFLRPRLDRANVVTPDTVDAHNLPLLVQSYLVAADAAEAKRPLLDSEHTTSLPCESRDLWRYFDDAGLTVAATPHYYAVTNARRGGIISICDRRTEQLVYEDSGVVMETGRRIWSSATPADVTHVEASAAQRTVASTVRCGRAGNLPLTPGKFLILRALGLTVFRSLALGGLLRRMIIARLITGRERGPCTCERSVRFEADRVTIDDSLALLDRRRVDGVRITRGFQPFHMGSARYFHLRDLRETPVVDRPAGGWTGPSAWSAHCVVRWSEAGVPSRSGAGAE
jgi:hypothetical protein